MPTQEPHKRSESDEERERMKKTGGAEKGPEGQRGEKQANVPGKGQERPQERERRREND